MPAPHAVWTTLVPLMALIPAIVCMLDITRHPNTRTLTPGTWLAICAFGNVLGLIVYLRYGREEHR
ncbi:hypothetical protein [Streptomyces sp. HUAS TT7]|uniref:hypothetical protein n=1 Tax=Streptomyces sp. HUAS TT7 TaxID=3447507 RepID=UPI003F65743A